MQKKWILFLLIYSISVFLLFTYILFPKGMFKKNIETVFSKHFSVQLSIDTISFRLPARFILSGLQVTSPEGTDQEKIFSMNLNEINLKPIFLKIPLGRIGIILDIVLDDGSIETVIDQKLFGQTLRF